MGMLFHYSSEFISPFFFFQFHFVFRTSDTRRGCKIPFDFYLGFHFSNHYILSVCLCCESVDASTACVWGRAWVRVSECTCVCACVRACLQVCMCPYVNVCVCVRSSSQIQYFLFCFIFITTLLFVPWLCSFCHQFLRHSHFSSPHCGICYDIHFYTNHLLFFGSEPAQSKEKVLSQTQTGSVHCRSAVHFIIWFYYYLILTGSTRQFQRYLNDNKHKKLIQKSVSCSVHCIVPPWYGDYKTLQYIRVATRWCGTLDQMKKGLMPTVL